MKDLTIHEPTVMQSVETSTDWMNPEFVAKNRHVFTTDGAPSKKEPWPQSPRIAPPFNAAGPAFDTHEEGVQADFRAIHCAPYNDGNGGYLGYGVTSTHKPEEIDPLSFAKEVKMPVAPEVMHEQWLNTSKEQARELIFEMEGKFYGCRATYMEMPYGRLWITNCGVGIPSKLVRYWR